MNMRDAVHIADDDLIQYALGTLTETQLSQFSAHISLCNVCREQLARTQLELASYAAVQPAAELPAKARERFLHRLAHDSAPASKFVQMRNRSNVYQLTRSFQSWLETPVPLKILSGVLAAALAFTIYDDLSHVHQIRQMMPAVARFERQSAEFAELKDFLRGSNAQQVTLHEKPALVKSMEGHALYSASTGKLIFTASNMPSPPIGKAYELWIIPTGGGAPIPAGVFTPDIEGNAALIFPDIPANVQAGSFGVTVEDERGVKTPTPPIILSGQ